MAVPFVLIATLACSPGATSGAGLHGGPEPSATAGAEAARGAIEVLNAGLAERIASLSERSPTWRAALDTLRRSGFRVIIGEPSDVRAGVPALRGYRVRHFGEVVPLRAATGALVGAVVAIDVQRVRRLVERAGLPPSVVDGDVERILIHEIYGHVVPLAKSRRLAGGCPDPAPGEPALSSCAIRRENRIRAELGLERRIAYDLTGLAVGRYLRATGGVNGAPGARDPR